MTKVISAMYILLILIACNSSTNEHQKEHTHSEKSEHHHTDHNMSNQHMNSTSFEDLAKMFESEERETWQNPDLVIEKMGELKGKSIADIGAGTGYFSFRLATQGAIVKAIDVDERFIAFMENRKSKEKAVNLETSLVGFDNPNLENNEFDIILIVNTYHHFNDKVEYMSHCLKGLKKGGILMNVDFKNQKTPHGPPVDHRISAEEVKNDLLKAGYTRVEIDRTSLKEQYILKAIK